MHLSMMLLPASTTGVTEYTVLKQLVPIAVAQSMTDPTTLLQVVSTQHQAQVTVVAHQAGSLLGLQAESVQGHPAAMVSCQGIL